MPNKRPNDWSPEDKLKVVLEAESLSDEQLGAFLRSKGLNETHLQQWRIQMLHGLDKDPKPLKTKNSAANAKQVRVLVSIHGNNFLL